MLKIFFGGLAMLSRRLRACLAGLALTVFQSMGMPARAAYHFDWYAPPMAYGMTKLLPAHLGPARYRITIEPIGNVPTQVTGLVTFMGPNGRLTSREFTHDIFFGTGNFVGQPTLRLKGSPTGTSVKVRVQ